MAYMHENKQAGQLIRSADWNNLGHALEQLEVDKVNRAGDTIIGDLQVGGSTTLGTPNKGSKLQVMNKQQDANGDTLILGQTSGSNLRLGYHANYAWVQAHGGKPLAINPLGNNVGVGTATPGEMLEVAGNLKVTGDRIKNSQGFGVMQMNAVDWLRINPDSQYPAIALFKPVAIGEGGLAIGEWGQLAKGELKATQSAYLATAGGHVGVGTTTFHNPQGWNKVFDVLGTGNARLNVRSSVGIVTSLFSHDNWDGPRGVVGTDSNHPLTFATNYAHRMTIDTAGNVGIGTTAPKQTLDVRGRMNVENGVIQRGGTAITATSDLGLYSQVSGNYIRMVTTGAPIRFYTDGGVGSAHALSIEANNSLVATGDVCADNSALYFRKTDHQHSGIGNTAGYAAIENSSNYGALMIMGRQTSDQGRVVGVWDRLNVNGRLFINGLEMFSDRITSSNGYSFVMQGDRNVVLYQPGGAVWSTGTNVSDVSLKKQITPLASPLEKVLNLRGVTFHWKDETMGTGREIGVIAQELEQVFPELVKSIDNRKFVKYEGLAPVLIEAIKEQQTLMDQMNEEIQTLKQSFRPAV